MAFQHTLMTREREVNAWAYIVIVGFQMVGFKGPVKVRDESQSGKFDDGSRLAVCEMPRDLVRLSSAKQCQAQPRSSFGVGQ